MEFALFLGRVRAPGRMEVTRRDACDERRVHRMVKPWVPTQDALDKLLAWLDPDRDTAGEKYEHIRRVLTRFFERQACARADERVDKTINVVTRRIAEGLEVRSPDPSSFFLGVAKNVYLESLKAAEARSVRRRSTGRAPGIRLQACPEVPRQPVIRQPRAARSVLPGRRPEPGGEALASPNAPGCASSRKE